MGSNFTQRALVASAKRPAKPCDEALYPSLGLTAPLSLSSFCSLPAEFAAAGSLASYLRSGVGFIPLEQRARLALHAVNGMAYLHSLKVVHFDVKPDNLLVDGDGLAEGGAVVKVVSLAADVLVLNLEQGRTGEDSCVAM
jgi:serine/threonine protein kinase